MEFELTHKDISEIEADAAIGMIKCPYRGAPIMGRPWDKPTDGLFREFLKSGEFKGKHQSTVLIHRPAGLKVQRLALVAAGQNGYCQPGQSAEAAGAAWRRLKPAGARSLVVRGAEATAAEDIIRGFVKGLAEADFEPGVYKTRQQGGAKLERVTICLDRSGRDIDPSPELLRELETSQALARGCRIARELGNEPANLLPPRRLGERALALAGEAGLECEVLDKGRLQELGMGALLGVAQGSAEPPVMILMRYLPDEERRKQAWRGHLGLVGKAVSFDTGGISIKPSKDMHWMKYDMAGGAAVIGAMVAIAELRPYYPVTAVIPSVENMPGGGAQRPGDVVTTRSGTTVEVLNTDAEGRLILADAITYAKELGCNRLVDAATLTGAVVVALGHALTGVFANDAEWRELVERAAGIAGEQLWPMPCHFPYKDQLESPIADLANIGSRWGGACSAAAFLRHFAGDTLWAHLDIAGTAWYERKLPHAPVGPSGIGAGTMAQLSLMNLS